MRNFAKLLVVVGLGLVAGATIQGTPKSNCPVVTTKEACCDRPCCKVECLCTPCRCSEHKDR